MSKQNVQYNCTDDALNMQENALNVLTSHKKQQEIHFLENKRK